MKKPELTEKPIKVTNPFDTTSHKNERSANQNFVRVNYQKENLINFPPSNDKIEPSHFY